MIPGADQGFFDRGFKFTKGGGFPFVNLADYQFFLIFLKFSMKI